MLELPKYEARNITHCAVALCDELSGLHSILKWLKFGYFITAAYKR